MSLHVFFGVAVCFVLAGCSGGRSPTSPSGPTVAPTATVNQRLTLQTSGGVQTTMWAVLLTVSPAPNSKVVKGSGFQMDHLFGFDQPGDGATVSHDEALFSFAFAMNQEAGGLNFLSWQSVRTGQTSSKAGGPWALDQPWRYLVVKGEYEAVLPGFGRAPVIGFAYFELNYR